MTRADITQNDHDALLAFCLSRIRSSHLPEEAAQMTLAQLGLDSLELIELQMELEDHHGLGLDVDALRAEMTLSELVASLQKLEG